MNFHVISYLWSKAQLVQDFRIMLYKRLDAYAGDYPAGSSSEGVLLFSLEAEGLILTR